LERPADAPALERALLAYGNFVFRHRNNLVPAAIALIVLLTRPRPWLGDERFDAVLDTIGILVSLTGQALRVLVIGLAYIQRGGKNKRIAADHLVTDGVFAHCRHPLYVGNFLLLLGLMMIWNSPGAYVIGMGGVGLSLFAMASAEEAFLRRKFGAAYEAYCARVNRFVPNFRGLRQTLADFHFDWKRVLRKEYGTTFSWTTTAVVLIILEHLEWDRWADARGVVIRAALAWLCLAALWGVARWMKKTRRLVSPD
jgi:protein-S-isoprenylcysteine O-methyltransferase Ste14